MAHTFLCPSCQAQHSVPEHLIGRRVRCPQCGLAIVVPEPKDQRRAVREEEPAAAGDTGETPEEALIPTKRWQSAEAEMDMTPMCDVTFQLLIFFMVTAAFAMQKSIEIPKPKEDAPSTVTVSQDPEEDPSFVTVYVDEFNTYRVVTPDWDVEAPSEQELLRKLREARTAGSGGTLPTKLLVKAHGDSLHEKVVAALDAGTEVGMEQVQLMTIEESE